VQTIDNTNGVFYPAPYPPVVSTDASGNITETALEAWISPIPTVLGGTSKAIQVREFDLASDLLVCTWIDPANDICGSVTTSSRGYVGTTGVWVTSDLPSIPIPTMTQWSMMLMALLLGMVGIARIRRQV